MMLNVHKQLQAPLSSQIAKAYQAFEQVVLQVPSSQVRLQEIDGTGGKVSVVDLIAYQIGWAQLLLGWYKAGLKGLMPQMPGDGFTTWDYTGLARSFYARYGKRSPEELLQLLRQSVIEIIECVEREDAAGRLQATGIWDWCTLPSGKQWPLAKWVQVNTVAPYKRATMLIKQYLKAKMQS